MNVRRTRLATAGGLAALLWLGSGALSHLLRGTRLSQPAELVLPVAVPGMMWAWPGAWGAIGIAVNVLTVAVLSWALLTLTAQSSRPSIFSAWLMILLATTAAGVAVGVGQLVAHIPLMGFSAFNLDPVQFLLGGAYWGVLYGWIPAKIAVQGAHRAKNQAVLQPTNAEALVEVLRPIAHWWVAGFAILAIAALTTVTTLGVRAERVANQQVMIEDGPELPDGVTVDPYAAGDPPPESIAAEGTRKPEWCTPEQAMLLLGTPDSASGHRVQPIRLMNFSEEECVVEGYPDIAFADQNGNLLDVVLIRGGSFMATDSGSLPVTVPPGGYAVTYLGWNANSTHNELVVTTIHAAQVAGDKRGSWSGQPGLDIIEGSEVFVTAWAPGTSYPAED